MPVVLVGQSNVLLAIYDDWDKTLFVYRLAFGSFIRKKRQMIKGRLKLRILCRIRELFGLVLFLHRNQLYLIICLWVECPWHILEIALFLFSSFDYPWVICFECRLIRRCISNSGQANRKTPSFPFLFDFLFHNWLRILVFLCFLGRGETPFIIWYTFCMHAGDEMILFALKNDHIWLKWRLPNESLSKAADFWVEMFFSSTGA